MNSSTVGCDRSLTPAAFMFGAGAFFSGLASGFAYFDQYVYQETQVDSTLTWEHPFCVAFVTRILFKHGPGLVFLLAGYDLELGAWG